MKPGKLNLIIYQGATFIKIFQWKSGNPPTSVDLTGCTARMQIRKKITDNEVLLNLTTENNRIHITPTEGKIEIRLTAAETAALNFKNGVYDLEIVYPGDEPVYRLIGGSVTVVPEVTR